MIRLSMFLAVLPALMAVGHAGAGEFSVTDFESLPPDLPGWSATLKGDEGQSEYRPADKWEAPFSFSLDSDKPHGGGASLLWEFSAETPGMVSLRVPFLPVPGPEITIRFFVRTQGVGSDGIFSFDESDTDGKRIKGHWSAAAIPQGDEWMEVSWTGRLGAATPGVRMSFVFKSMPAGAKVWIDDLTITQAGEN